MFEKMKQLMELQKKAKQIQQELEATKFEKESRDGKIRIILNGNFRLEKLDIDPSLLSVGGKEKLEKEICELITEAGHEVKGQMKSQAVGMMKNMGLGMPGM